MNFKVVFVGPRGVAVKKYKGTDTYDILPSGVLRVDSQRTPDKGIHHFPPGRWVEVAEHADPVTPNLDWEDVTRPAP